MYTQITHAIKISVDPVFLEERSDPDDDHFVWAYQVHIQNNRNETVTLLKRRWMITDQYGTVHEVKGEGVVGEQPTLAPGDSFSYTSGTPLSAPSGMMFGEYTFVNAKGEKLKTHIPAFSLDSPYAEFLLN